MLAVERAIELAQLRGVPLLANIRVNVPASVDFAQIPYGVDGRLDVLWLAVRILDNRERGLGTVVLLDECGVLFNSREWQEFPPGLAVLMAQGRKLLVDLVLTAQFVDQVDKTLRELCEVAHHVRAWPSPSNLGRSTGRRPLLMVVSSYRPGNVDNPKKRLGRNFILYRRRREAAYDTDELVMPKSAILAALAPRSRRGRSQPPQGAIQEAVAATGAPEAPEGP
jgi:hypothetical protein